MYKFRDVSIRKFTKEDIPLKIKWVNDENNNKFLHYDLPLEYEKTVRWFETNKDNANRFDAVVEYNNKPIGLVGLLDIDFKNRKAEEYILIGEPDAKGKHIGTKAYILNALYAFEVLKLNKLYAYIEFGNPYVKSKLKRGYNMEGFLRNDIYKNNEFIDVYILGLEKKNLVIPDDFNLLFNSNDEIG